MNANADSSPWPDLPSDLLELISERLETYEDRQQLRLVCKSWLSGIISRDINTGPPSLHKRLPDKFDLSSIFPQINPQYQTVVPTAVYILRRGINDTRWLVCVHQLERGKYLLVHPVTNVEIMDYSQFQVNDYFVPEKIRNFVPLKINTGYTINIFDTAYKLKTIYCENPKISSNNHTSQDFLVILRSCGVLVVLSTMGDDSNNSSSCRLAYGNQRKFTDIAKWKNRVWAVNWYGVVYGVDFETAKVTTVLAASTNMKDDTERRKRLFESKGELHMIVKSKSSVDIQVYRLNPARDVWEKLSSLGNNILFISNDSCYLAKATDLGLGSSQGNCIVFPEGCFTTSMRDIRLVCPMVGPRGYLSMAVYDYGGNASSSDDRNNLKPLSDTELPSVFWPPPRWVWEDCDPEKSAASSSSKKRRYSIQELLNLNI